MQQQLADLVAEDSRAMLASADGSATSADGDDAAPPGLIPGEGVARAGERSEVTA